MKWSAKDNYGSFLLCQQGQIVEATLHGVGSDRLCQWYSEALSDLLDTMPSSPWGYLGNFTHFHAWAKGLEDSVAQQHCMSVNSGCIAAGYVVPNPVVKTQLNQVRRLLGFRRDLGNFEFADRDLALDYLSDVLQGRTKEDALLGRVMLPGSQPTSLMQFSHSH